MEYQDLTTYKYNGSGPTKTSEEVETEYQRRLDGYATVVTNLYPTLDKDEYVQQSNFPLFFVQTNRINTLINTVNRNSKQINDIATPLPGVAKTSYKRKLLSQEIYYTNKIEGVKTTKQEIGTVVGELDSKHMPQKRLSSTVKLYNDTSSGKSYQINSLSDFRKIYDELLKGEISDDNLPDGEFFRDSKDVYIGNDISKVHTPPQGEKEIQSKLIPLITFMNNHDLLDIVKAIVTHFMFENVHPFYDGNGRTGRYLLSSYLSNKLDSFTGLSVSGAIHAEQRSYYKAFQQADQFENRADLTLFITKMLEIISQGQLEVIQDLTKLSKKLRDASTEINSAFPKELERVVLFIFAQSFLFTESVETGIKDTQLVDMLYSSNPKTFKKVDVRRTISKLENEGVLTSISKRPLQHVINKEYISSTQK